ncbi:MAG: uroporphyrinogen decarboxylase [Solibacterales bacterium]|nr:uroporphyrinogen decarboxylase [Bryobacterales bacterium]
MSTTLIEACWRRPVSHTPVWFMRQAGRYMPEYRNLRKSHSILEICKDPELATQVTLQPIEMLGVDAAIIFADLLLPVEPMGIKLEFLAGEGPALTPTIRSLAQIEKLNTKNGADLGYVLEAITLVKQELANKIPVIGFVGAPFTLASYMIEGGSSRHYIHTKKLMYEAPVVWNQLLSKIVDALVPYAIAQIESGADAIQVFDSWVGALSPSDYERYVLPHSKRLIEKIQDAKAPVIHFGTGAGSYLNLFHKAGGEVLGLDWRVHLDEAWASINHDAAVQGNLDPLVLFAPLEEIRHHVKDVLRRAAGRPGHIFNLGHGILPGTPVDNVKAVVEMVREFTI